MHREAGAGSKVRDPVGFLSFKRLNYSYLFVCMHGLGMGGSFHGVLVEVRGQFVGVSLLLLSWALGIKPGPSSLVASTSMQAATSPAPTWRLLGPQCICVHISVLWTYSTPGHEPGFPSPGAPTSATSSHSSLSWSIGSWFFPL